jgi:DNA-binding transcriptional regulator YiaG
MADRAPSTFADLVGVLDDLPAAIRAVRRARRLSLRQVGEQAGVSFSTVSRVESGADCDTGTVRALLLWLDKEPTHVSD